VKRLFSALKITKSDLRASVKEDIADATVHYSLNSTNEFQFFCHTIPIAVTLKLNCSVFHDSNSC